MNDPNVNVNADDTVLYMSDQCPEVARNEDMMEKLYNWCKKNKLTINLKKTKKHMMICRGKNLDYRNINLCIKIDNHPIDAVSSYHYLGADLDNGLSYDKMLGNMSNWKLYMLKRIRRYITNSIANLVYKTHVLPRMNYADFLVDSGRMDNIERLENLKKRALKVIDNKLHRGLNLDQLLTIYGLRI